MTAPPEAASAGPDRERQLGFILNATYVAESDGGRAVVHLYGRLADGRPFLVRDRRPEPYFYLESSAADRARGLGIHDLDATDRRTLHGAPVHRVRLHHPGDTPAVRGRLHRAGIPTYEADVRFAYRYLIDRGIKSALRIHGAARPLEGEAADAREGARAAGQPWLPGKWLAVPPATGHESEQRSELQPQPPAGWRSAPPDSAARSRRRHEPGSRPRVGSPDTRAERRPEPGLPAPAGSPRTPPEVPGSKRRGSQPSHPAAGWPAAWETVVFDEPEVEPARWVPELTTLSLDIETDPKAQRLLSVALWGCGAREVLLLCPDAVARASCPADAVPCADEAELLTVLCMRVRALDPDVVTGWNIIDFDVPVLIRRAAELKVPLELGRAPGAVRQRGESRGRGGSGSAGDRTSRRRFSDSIFIPGRVVLDGIRLLRAVFLPPGQLLAGESRGPSESSSSRRSSGPLPRR